jgi:hypothetical protein
MRFLLVISTILLFFEYSNLVQFFSFTDADVVVLCYDCESEEEKKTEKDPKKFDKLYYSYAYSSLLTFLSQHKGSAHKAGLCMKGHCAIIDQPPEA